MEQDELKGKTLDEITGLIKTLNSRISSKKAELDPMLKEVKPLRAKIAVNKQSCLFVADTLLFPSRIWKANTKRRKVATMPWMPTSKVAELRWNRSVTTSFFYKTLCLFDRYRMFVVSMKNNTPKRLVFTLSRHTCYSMPFSWNERTMRPTPTYPKTRPLNPTGTIDRRSAGPSLSRSSGNNWTSRSMRAKLERRTVVRNNERRKTCTSMEPSRWSIGEIFCVWWSWNAN